MRVYGPTFIDEVQHCAPWGGWMLPRIGARNHYMVPPRYRVRDQHSGRESVVREIPIIVETRPGEFDDIINIELSEDSDCEECFENFNNNSTTELKHPYHHHSQGNSASSRKGKVDFPKEDAKHYGNFIDLDNANSTPPKRIKSDKPRRPQISPSDIPQTKSEEDFVLSLIPIGRTPDSKTGKRAVTWDENDGIEKVVNEAPSYSVYSYLNNFLKTTNQQIDYMRGDGNCFFRSLSKVINGTEWLYGEVRSAVCDLMEKYPSKFEQFIDGGSMDDHISEMREDKTWATQTEIYAAATLLNRDIYILSPDQGGDNYRWLLFSPQFEYKSDLSEDHCFITLCHTHGNHYDRIAQINNRCNCNCSPPTMSGICATVDLTYDEIV